MGRGYILPAQDVYKRQEIESAWAYWGNYQTQSQYLRADYIKQFEYILPKALKKADDQTFF